jgi:tRNA/rRNA methyltransferase
MTKASAEAGRLNEPKARKLPKSRATPKPKGFAPVVVLVAPQLGENIGFAARAMANFGLSELRLVAPRDGWPNEKARAAAAGADEVIDGAVVYETLERSIADLNYLLATTARPRGMTKSVLTLEGAAHDLAARGGMGERVGIMFGPERSGLDNDAISLADAIVTAPVNPAFASLSLPQTVLLVAYEWWRAQTSESTLGRATSCDGPATEGLDLTGTRAATRAELFQLFDHLETELDRSGFLRPPKKRPTMVRAIRAMFHRMGATEQDVRTWRGIVASLSGSNRRPRKGKGS